MDVVVELRSKENIYIYICVYRDRCIYRKRELNADKEYNTGHEDVVGAVAEGGGSGGVDVGGGGRDEPELLGQHAAGAAEGSAHQNRGVGGSLAAAEECRRLRRRLPELEAHHQGDRQVPRTLWKVDLPHLRQAGPFSPFCSHFFSFFYLNLNTICVLYVSD